MIEEWKEIEGFHKYEVSTFGRVRRGKKILKAAKRNGYLLVSLFGKEGRRTLSVHRLVAQAFIPNPENLPFVNHKDENPGNPLVDNLEWCTHTYNVNYGTCQKRHADTIRGHPKLGAAGRPMKAVLQLKDNCYIGYFESSQEAERKTGVNYRHISECCQFKRKSAGGFQWVRDLDYLLLIGLL